MNKEYFHGNPTPEGNNAWGGYTMAERAGYGSHRNLTRIAKIKVADRGVRVQGHAEVGSKDVNKMLFAADRTLGQLDEWSRSRVTGLVRSVARDEKGTQPFEITAPTFAALNKAMELDNAAIL